MKNEKTPSFEEEEEVHSADCSFGDCFCAAEAEEVNAVGLDERLPSAETPKDMLTITIEQDQFDLMKVKNKLLPARFLEVEEDKNRAEEAGAALPSKKQLSSSILRRPQRDACQATQSRRGTQPGAGKCRWGKQRRVFISPDTGLKHFSECDKGAGLLELKRMTKARILRSGWRHTVNQETENSSSNTSDYHPDRNNASLLIDMEFY